MELAVQLQWAYCKRDHWNPLEMMGVQLSPLTHDW